MEMFFPEMGEPPLPQAEVRIRELQAEPWNDGQRVSVNVELAPFQRRPNLDFVIRDAEGRILASASVLETAMRKLSLTMHLRGLASAGRYTLEATLYFTDLPDESQSSETHQELHNVITDTAQIEFEMSSQ